MIKISLQKQQLVILSLSLLTSVLLLLLRVSFLPHSTQYIFLHSLNSLKLSPLTLIHKEFYFLVLCLIFLSLLFLSLEFLLKEFKRYKYKASLPLIINLCTIILFLFIQDIVISQDFNSNLEARKAVVTMIKSGSLQQNESQRVARLDNLNRVLHKVYKLELPTQYSHVSQSRNKPGQINLITNRNNENKMIVFFTSMSDFNYTAWVYKMNANIPIENYLFGVGDLKSYAWLLDTKQVNDNWSWVDVVEK